MAQIAYLLLCHKAPQAVIAQARLLVSSGDAVVLHYDGRRPRAEFLTIRKALADEARIAFAPRVRCGWGQWSLVEATLGAARTALAKFPDATHLYMISGECAPIRSAQAIHAQLDADDADIIETVDFHTSGWIRTGLREDRLIYRHHFNERRHKRLFYLSLEVQRRLRLARSIPDGLAMRIGSQWWCLRRGTVEAVLRFADPRPDVVRFFRTTWIPDETFFQTLVPHVVPAEEIRSRPPTFLMFSDYGMPVTFHDDHYDMLISQEALFARKISARSAGLRDRLAALYAAKDAEPPPATDGRALFRFLTTRGRNGQRFAPPAWTHRVPGPNREIRLVVCKKWHIGTELAQAISTRTGAPWLGYPFSEADCALPDLGGLGATLETRRRDPRAFTEVLFPALGTDRLILCLDPSDLATARDLYGSGAFARLLDVACTFDEDYLAGHAARVGLTAPAPQPVGPVLAAELHDEATRLAEAFPHRHRIAPPRAPDRNAAALADMLDISPEDALEIARNEAFLAG